MAHPETGGRQAVAEAWRNLQAVGATPLALTNNLNFGNPERSFIMGQFVGCVKGIGAAAAALEFPVISGNVSLYNETNGRAIMPTPVIGGVGHIPNIDHYVGIALPKESEYLVLIGATQGWLGCTIYLREICGMEEGAPPPVDFETERRHGKFVNTNIRGGIITACHDLSDGGLLTGLTEMVLAGDTGATIEYTPNILPHAWYFGEDQGRYLCVTPYPDKLLSSAKKFNVAALMLGQCGGDMLNIPGGHTISIELLRENFETWLPKYMAEA